ncbi:MAG: hypothetical protein WBG92_07490 [Thiohalocapsa sp.]
MIQIKQKPWQPYSFKKGTLLLSSQVTTTGRHGRGADVVENVKTNGGMVMKTVVASRWLGYRLLFALVALMCCSAVQAEDARWSCTHGQDGNIEYGASIQAAASDRAGWGLDFTQQSGLKNWVHFAVPSVHGASVRHVALRFWTGSADAFVDKVHVYNLEAKVKEFEDLGWSGGWLTKTLDLGAPAPISALGISVEIAAGVEAMSHRFVFSGACGLMTQPD